MSSLATVDYRRLPPWSDLPQHRIPSDFAPANLVLFAPVHHYEMQHGELPCIAGVTYDGVRHLIPLFDLRLHEPAVLSRRLAGYECFFPVPGEWTSNLDRNAFTIEYDCADSDYLFDASAMRDLTGAARRDRRNQALRFEQEHAPQAEPVMGSRAARAILDGWLADVERDVEATDWRQTNAALVHRRELGLYGLLARTAEGRPAGFILASQLGECAIIHFAKGRRAFTGVYPWLFRQLARAQPELRWLNFEQDLGNAGFRRNKQAFAPDDFVHKYRVAPR